MKKNPLFKCFTFFLAAFALPVLFSCSDVSESKDSVPSAPKTYTVHGKVTLGAANGATSGSLLASLASPSTGSARSATSSLTEYVNEEKINGFLRLFFIVIIIF